MLQVTLEDVKQARETIKDIVKKTDVLESTKLSEKTGAHVYYKCENLQKTGSFKVRGACNKIANLTEEEKARGVIAASAGNHAQGVALTEEEKARGVIAASAGNHAQGVALGAKLTGIKATIAMPATAPLAKVSATKGYGAEVVLNGTVYDDAYAKAVEVQKETGATFLHPFNDKYVIAGQGTLALEFFEQLDNKVDTVLCPIGGGGIVAGVAVVAKALNPNCKVIGVQTANIPSMKESFQNGEAGQGTLALEFFEQLDNKVDTVLCPIGGGGIVAGVAVVAKALNPNCKVIGVQTANIPSMKESFQNGEVTSALIGGGGIVAGVAVVAKALNPNCKVIGVQTANIPSMKESFQNGEVTSAFNAPGGIVAGVAVVAKALNPNCKVIGVQTANIPSMKESFQNGEVTSAFNAPTIADGIAVKTPGDLTFDIIKELVDDVVVVEEDEIAQAILFMMESQKIVSEGAGAVSTAALLSGKYKPEAGENVVCVVSGGNVDVNTLYRIIGVALAKVGRRWW